MNEMQPAGFESGERMMLVDGTFNDQAGQAKLAKAMKKVAQLRQTASGREQLKSIVSGKSQVQRLPGMGPPSSFSSYSIFFD
jgi:transcription antitermination factor NusG